MRFSTAIIAAAALAMAGQAWAQTSPADGPVGTAPSGEDAPLSTPQQIDQYLASSPAVSSAADPYRQGLAATDADGKRRIHGAISLGVGTGGYRSGSVSAVFPVGETGVVALSYGQTKNGHVYGRFGDPRYGYDSRFAPSALEGDCAASGPERAWYGQSAPGGASQAWPERCARP